MFDAVNKYNFTIQHLSGAMHQYADALSRMRLTKRGWTECPDCKHGLPEFADEDENVLTRHNEELVIGPLPGAPTHKAHSGVLLTRSKTVQANTFPHLGRLQPVSCTYKQ